MKTIEHTPKEGFRKISDDFGHVYVNEKGEMYEIKYGYPYDCLYDKTKEGLKVHLDTTTSRRQKKVWLVAELMVMAFYPELEKGKDWDGVLYKDCDFGNLHINNLIPTKANGIGRRERKYVKGNDVFFRNLNELAKYDKHIDRAEFIKGLNNNGEYDSGMYYYYKTVVQENRFLITNKEMPENEDDLGMIYSQNLLSKEIAVFKDIDEASDTLFIPKYLIKWCLRSELRRVRGYRFEYEWHVKKKGIQIQKDENGMDYSETTI